MEATGGDGESQISPVVAKWKNDFSRAFQYYLDRSAPHMGYRWLGTLAAAAIYVLRVYYGRGFYIISYGIGIYILNLLIGFLSPKVDPEIEALDGASSPTKESDEFRPFIRRLPEFKFWRIQRASYFLHNIFLLVGYLLSVSNMVLLDALWYAITKAFCVAFFMTFFSAFDVPVFWPILFLYWVFLFFLTTKRLTTHMIKHKYVPFNIRKQRYARTKSQ